MIKLNQEKNSKLYAIWKKMRQKCNNPKSEQYKYYGERGIKIHSDWDIYWDFQLWCESNGWKEGLTLDRKLNDGDYSPDNCRITTRAVQSRNTRAIRCHNTTGFRGVSFNKSSGLFHATIAVNGKNKYLGRYATAKEASDVYISYVKENNLEHNYE